MNASPPTWIDPLRYAREQRSFSGSIALSELRELTNCLADTMGEVHFTFSFRLEPEEDLLIIRGELDTRFTLECQRCLQPLEHIVHAVFTLSPIRTSQEAHTLPAGYEPVLLEQGKVSWRQMVEEELLLALPMVPLHAPGMC